MNNWKNPKIIVGPTATGDYYFNRPLLTEKIWEEILKGSHILIAAPRRVGKSSVMEYMVANCPEDTKCFFKNIQGIKTEKDFYKALYELIILCLSKFQKGKNWLGDFLGGINIEEITLEGVKFGERKTLNCLDEINKILPKLQSNDLKIVLFIDELPEVLNNLHKAKKTAEASNIIDNLRQWRQMPILKKHFSMVLAGSVGIHHVVKTIDGRLSDLNDLHKVDFEALSQPDEAKEYITWATNDATVQYNEELQSYLLEKISYPIPYFINLMLDEINKQAIKTKKSQITTKEIDDAFDRVVKHSDHFVEWKNRLFQYFPESESSFMNEVLIYISHKNKINKRQLYNLAVKHQRTNDYIEIMDGLERDGYITEQADNYVFISPFLKAFWKRSNPVYDGK